MEYISPSELRSFLDPQAFAVSRTTARGELDLTQAPKAIQTTKTDSTLSLLLGAEQRLADFRTSLQTMLDISIAGAQSRGNERKYDEAYGKLRSLSAGFDQVLQATTFGGQVIFDGRDWNLSANGQPVDLEGIDLRAAGEELGLVEETDGARVTVSYDPATIIHNQNTGLVGLDIAGATGIARTDGLPELENGKYRLEIEYAGPNSTLVFSDQYGAKIEELTDIDLTGSGMDIIKFKAGIMINLEKLKSTIGYDKWDYEIDGPVSLYADLKYERVSWHSLAGDTNTADASAETEWTYKARKNYGDPALNLGDISINGIKDGMRELAAGDYQMAIKFRGADSIVEIKDINGMMISRFKADLGPDPGTYTVDTNMGVKFTVENKNWGSTPKDIRATFKYTPATNGERNFDFVGYGQRLIEAIGVVDNQLSSVTSSIDQIQERVQWARGTATGGTINATALLGGGGSIASLLSGGSVRSRITVSGMQLFSSINSAVSTQGAGATNLLNFLA